MKRVIGLLLVLTLFIGIPISYAEPMFTDIDEGHWAKDYIDKMTQQNIMIGFADATFKPNKPVSKLEVIVALYNMVVSAGKFNRGQVDVLVMRHTDEINNAHIPKTLDPYGDVIWDAVAFALDNNIIHSDELDRFIIDGQLVNANKLETVIFMGKTMNLYFKENLERIVFFDYADAVKIPGQVAVYVDMLIQHGIINKKGDKNRNFNPQNDVTRATLATMLSAVFDEIADEKEKNSHQSEDNKQASEEVMDIFPSSDDDYEGIISSVHKKLGVIEIRDNDGQLHTYDGNTASYEKQGSAVELSDLKIGMSVSVYDTNGELSKLVIQKEYDNTKGFLHAISGELKDDDGIYEVITVSTDDGKKYFKIYDDAIVMRNGELVKKTDLTVGDKVSISADGFFLKHIETYAEHTTLEGVLNKESTFKKGDSISIKLMDGAYIDQIMDNDITIIGDDGIINRGDMVNLTLEYGIVTQIEDTGINTEVIGSVKSIFIGEESKVQLDINGIIKTILLGDDIKYVLSDDENTGSIYDLRLNQMIMMTTGMDGEKTITLTKPTQTKKWSGKINEIFVGANLLKVVDGSGKKWTVTIKDTSNINLMKYAKDDMIFLVGSELSSDVFTADMIVGQ